MDSTCALCGNPVNMENDENYRQVTSWVTGPKLDSPVLREQSGRVAHKKCIDHLVHGQAPDQPELEFTDEPGKIIKLTGANSLHEAVTGVVRCDAEAQRGTGTGRCNQVLDKHGECPNAGNHLF